MPLVVIWSDQGHAKFKKSLLPLGLVWKLRAKLPERWAGMTKLIRRIGPSEPARPRNSEPHVAAQGPAIAIYAHV